MPRIATVKVQLNNNHRRRPLTLFVDIPLVWGIAWKTGLFVDLDLNILKFFRDAR